MIKLDLSIPPSVNNIWNPVYKGYKKAAMVRSPEYSAWLNKAGYELNVQRPRTIEGEYELIIFFPRGMRGDIDNRVKPINDLLQKHRVIKNDSLNKSLNVRVNRFIPLGMCEVWVRKFDEDYVGLRFELETQFLEHQHYEIGRGHIPP